MKGSELRLRGIPSCHPLVTTCAAEHRLQMERCRGGSDTYLRARRRTTQHAVKLGCESSCACKVAIGDAQAFGANGFSAAGHSLVLTEWPHWQGSWPYRGGHTTPCTPARARRLAGLLSSTHTVRIQPPLGVPPHSEDRTGLPMSRVGLSRSGCSTRHTVACIGISDAVWTRRPGGHRPTQP